MRNELKNCPKCGKFIPANSKTCRYCNAVTIGGAEQKRREIDLKIRRCPRCGHSISDNSLYCSECGAPYKAGKQTGITGGGFLKNNILKIITVIAVIIVLIFLLVLGKKLGFIGSKSSNGSPVVVQPHSNSNNSQTEEKKESGDSGEEIEEPSEAQSDQKSNEYTLLYTDNAYANEQACLSPDDYEIFYADDFSFGYPKYIFSDSNANDSENIYQLWNDQGYSLNVSKIPVESGSADQNAHVLFETYKKTYDKLYFERDTKGVDDQGNAHALVGGFLYSDHSGEYVIVASNGSYNYVLVMRYPDPDPEVFFKPINYIVDCVYRYCSFSGTTYQPRSYDLFLQDKMGDKK